MPNKYITIPGFKGGQSIDPYESVSQQGFQKTDNLDIFVDSNLLKPVPVALVSMPIPDVAGQSSVRVYNSYLASNGVYYFCGQADISAAVNFVLWSTSLSLVPTWTSRYASGGTGTPGNGMMEEYKDGLFFGWSTNLDRFGDLSGSPSRSNIGSVTTGVTFLRNHRGLGFLFVIHNSGRTIGRYDNSTWTASKLTFDKDDTAVGIEEYGRWCIIGLRGSGSKKSRFVLWDGAATTVDDIYNLEDNTLQSFRIVNGEIRYLGITNNGIDDRLKLSVLIPGNKPQVVRDQKVTLSSGSNSINPNALASNGDILLYGLNGITYSDLDLGVFAYGSPKENLRRMHTLWRLVSTGVKSGVSIVSIKHNSSSIIVIWGDGNNGSGTQTIDVGLVLTSAPPSNGVYESNIIALEDGLPGRVKKITINHKAIPSSCGFTLQIKHYGAYPWGDSVPGDTFTVTIASPGVFTKAGHGYVAGDSVRFSTTGSLPTGLTAGTSYYIISTGLTDNTFQVSASIGGSAVNTTGSQSGTHSVDRYMDLLTPEGSGTTVGRTQSTNGAEVTEISGNELFKEARYIQLRLKFDEISGTTSPTIVFPIIIETV